MYNCAFITELTSKMDLQALSGKTLTVTSGSSSPVPASTTDALVCPYVNLLLCNAQPAGEKQEHANNSSQLRRQSLSLLEDQNGIILSYYYYNQQIDSKGELCVCTHLTSCIEQSSCKI